MSEESTLDRSRAVRGGHRGVVTKLVREAEEITRTTEPLDSARKTRLSVIKQQLDVKLSLLNEMDKDILSRCEIDSIADELEESEAVTAKIITCKQRIDEIVPTATPVTSASPSYLAPASLPTPVTVVKPRLPRLQLPKFKGDVKNWPAFWDSFKSAVHDNSEIPKVDKFNYLNSLLEGTALKTIQGLTLTDGHYDTAVGMLRERFGDPQQIICSHMESLLKIPNCSLSGERTCSLRSIYDKVMVNIRGLEALGITSEQYGSLLIPVIMTKFPSEIRLRIARELGKNAWRITPLLNILKAEVEAREVSDGSTISSMKSSTVQSPRVSSNSTGSALVANSYKVRCAFCGGDHYSAACSTVTSVKERRDILLKAGRCFMCLKSKHKSKDCDSQRTCRHCHRRHHQSICEQALPTQHNSDSTESSQSGNATNTTNSVSISGTTSLSKATAGKGVVLLQTAQAIAIGETKRKPVRILFDSGSQLSYATKALQDCLGLKPIRREKLRINTFGTSSFHTNPCDIIQFHIQSVNSGEILSITAHTSPVICSPLPRLVDSSMYSHLSGLELADTSDSAQGIDVLIGSDHYWSIVTGETIMGDSGPVAVSSRLGWLLSGPSDSGSTMNLTHSNLIVNGDNDNLVSVCESDDIVSALKCFWDTESIGIIDDPHIHAEEDPFLERLQFRRGRYEVHLPWKDYDVAIPDHFDLCLNRLRLLHTRLLKSPELLERYHATIQEQLKKGIVEVVEDSRDAAAGNTPVHYLPHHGVLRHDKQTTKLRVVYDGSAKTKTDPLSLNDCLKTGPNMIPKLFDVLVKFRWQSVALTADIEQAFLMIGITPKDRDVIRFLWFKDPRETDSEIVKLRFARLVFGLRPSPAILGSVISHHLDKCQDQLREVCQSVKNSFYVDDLISGGATIEEAFNIYSVAKRVMAEGGFNLRKWNSNSQELMSKIVRAESESSGEVADDHSPGERNSLQFIVGNTDAQSKLLGVGWDSCSDELLFNFSVLFDQVRNLPPSRRSLLKITASIFDPLGILSPFVIKLKVMFQALCCQRAEWDQPLDGEFLQQWNKFLSEFEVLNGLRVSRCYFEKGLTPHHHELHGFSDASEHAYAAAIYLRTVYVDGTISTSLIASKTRVSPVKKQSIPRLELLGALILTRLADSILKQLPLQLTVTYWVDSTTAMFWIKNQRPWKQYVLRRVSEIRSLSSPDQWRHCPGAVNPADFPSRGLEAQKLRDCTIWWEGPPFLKSCERDWPDLVDPSPSDTVMEEVTKTPAQDTYVLANVAGSFMLNLTNVIDCQRFSDFRALLRVTAYALKFLERLKGSPLKVYSVQYSSLELEAVELERAEVLWVRSIQTEAFDRELHYLEGNLSRGKPLYVDQFGLYVDDHHVLRCKGRIDNSTLTATEKHPVLLPTKHPFVKLLVREIHGRVKHGGVNTTLAATREKYWILKGRQLIKGILRGCVVCKKAEGSPYCMDAPPPLPDFRVSDSPPFTHTGLDFAGPLYVRDSKDPVVTSKVYICLFTCASTRAIHLELTRSLSADSFLLAFRRFVGRRGLPAMLISDNAKTFKSSSKEIRSICRATEVSQYLCNNRTSWRFIVAKSPWWGGFYERMVQTVKRPLRKVIGRSNLRFDELNTVLIEVESVINCRPLTFVYDDCEGVSYALTPSHLLYGRRMASSPCSGHYEVVSTNASLTKRSRNHRHVLNQIISCWRKDYLLSLREVSSTKRTGSGPVVKVGDVVILKDDSVKRLFWKLAKVVELLKGSDGVARAALINVSNEGGPPRILKRSTRHLIPIEVSCDANLADVPPRVETPDQAKDKETVGEPDDSSVPSQNNSSRPRRQAAILGERLRRTWTGH